MTTLLVEGISHLFMWSLIINYYHNIDASTTKQSQPNFLSTENRNIVTTKGQTAYLQCKISSHSDSVQISWIRKRDLHVLSSGKIVFASDQRFQVINQENSNVWTLQIKYTQPRDKGIYECQINSVPKRSLAFNLDVVASRAVIKGPEYVKAGSTINLTCSTNQPVMQGLVHWYQNGKILDWEGKVTITAFGNNASTLSQLTISNARPSDSGNFTCWPTEAVPTSVYLTVVLEGEQPAAMQSGARIEIGMHPSSIVSSILVTLLRSVCLPLLSS